MDNDIQIFWNEEKELWGAKCLWHDCIITERNDRDAVVFKAGFHVGYSH